VTVNPVVVPTFTAVDPICSGEILSALPTTSNNGIAGSWSPAFNNTMTTTYSFTPDAGQCATTAELTITVISCGDADDEVLFLPHYVRIMDRCHLTGTPAGGVFSGTGVVVTPVSCGGGEVWVNEIRYGDGENDDFLGDSRTCGYVFGRLPVYNI
jgi:hypothetical protein